MDDSNIKRKTGDDDVISSSKKKKAKKSTTTAKFYVYPVFETFDGMRCPDYEGGVKEKSVQLMGIFMDERYAEVYCEVKNREANQIKEALEEDVDKYESSFSYKKTSLLEGNNVLPQPITISREGDTEPGPGGWKSDGS